jgi:hypothetical protein
MRWIFWTIFLVLIVGVAGYWYTTQTPSPQLPQNGDGSEEIDTSDWELYENEQFGFTLQYPPEWEVHKAPDDIITPKFNVYKPSDASSSLPFIHHSSATHVSVFPEGVPTEGVSGETRRSDVDFQVSVREPRDYILANGNTWATFAGVKDAPASWTEAGFIFAGLLIKNHSIDCFRNDEQVPSQQCDPLTGDRVVHHGSVNEKDRRIQQEILASFQFK